MKDAVGLRVDMDVDTEGEVGPTGKKGNNKK